MTHCSRQVRDMGPLLEYDSTTLYLNSRLAHHLMLHGDSHMEFASQFVVHSISPRAKCFGKPLIHSVIVCAIHDCHHGFGAKETHYHALESIRPECLDILEISYATLHSNTSPHPEKTLQCIRGFVGYFSKQRETISRLPHDACPCISQSAIMIFDAPIRQVRAKVILRTLR